jgi:hypothetical protein
MFTFCDQDEWPMKPTPPVPATMQPTVPKPTVSSPMQATVSSPMQATVSSPMHPASGPRGAALIVDRDGWRVLVVFKAPHLHHVIGRKE